MTINQKIQSIIVLTALTFGSPAHAQAPAYTLIKDKSSLGFTAVMNDAKVEGKFTDFTADIHFAPKELSQSSVKMDVNSASVTSTNDDVATNIKQPEWLSVAAFPHAVFTAQGFEPMPSAGHYVTHGELQLKDTKLPVTLEFQITPGANGIVTAKGFAVLKRGDFGIGQGEWSSYKIIKNEVNVEFNIVAVKQ